MTTRINRLTLVWIGVLVPGIIAFADPAQACVAVMTSGQVNHASIGYEHDDGLFARLRHQPKSAYCQCLESDAIEGTTDIKRHTPQALIAGTDRYPTFRPVAGDSSALRFEFLRAIAAAPPIYVQDCAFLE